MLFEATRLLIKPDTELMRSNLDVILQELLIGSLQLFVDFQSDLVLLHAPAILKPKPPVP